MSAWVAVLAMALNALWPLIAQAKPGAAPSLLEVCTSAGLQKIAVGGEPPADSAPGAKVSPHCAFCSFSSDQVAILPPAQTGIAQVAAVRDSLPVHIEAPLPEPFLRSPAQPRAPPFLS